MYLYQRGNRWWVSEQVNGKQVRRSLGPDIITAEQAAAVAFGGRTVNEVRVVTLEDVFEDFLVDARIRLARTSVARYRFSFRLFSASLGDSMPITELTRRRINAWTASQLDRGRSPEGVNLDLRHIRAVLRRAQENELISSVPKIDMVKTSKRLPRHLTADQVKAILAAESIDEYRRLWTFFVWTGLRRNEALSLKWSDVTLGDNPSMRVVGKGDRERVVPLLTPALEAMGAPQASGLVFNVAGGSQTSRRFKMAARAAGVPTARLHDLRHTCLTWLVGHQVPLKLVQDIAGHASITTTMRYAKIFTGNAHEVLNKAFGF